MFALISWCNHVHVMPGYDIYKKTNKTNKTKQNKTKTKTTTKKNNKKQKSRFYLLIIWSPNTTRYIWIIKVQHIRPIPLSRNRSHQHKAITITDQSHSSIMRPGKVCNLKYKVTIHMRCKPSFFMSIVVGKLVLRMR